MPASYFEALKEGGGATILGVNCSFGFVPPSSDVSIGPNDLLDENNDGFDDFAMCEIYFNDYFTWGIGTDYDIETVFLHELGHSIGLGHSNSLNSIMDPYYSGVSRTLSVDYIAGVSALYPVPEPATMMLLGSLATGLFGVAGIKNRRS